MKTLKPEDRVAAREALFDQILQWTKHQEGWDISEVKNYYDSVGGNEPTGYEEPARLIKTPQGDVRLEPIGYKPDGTDVIEISAWPTLIRIRLHYIPKKQTWEMKTDSGIPFHHDWNEPNFVRLVQDLLAA